MRRTERTPYIRTWGDNRTLRSANIEITTIDWIKGSLLGLNNTIITQMGSRTRRTIRRGRIEGNLLTQTGRSALATTRSTTSPQRGRRQATDRRDIARSGSGRRVRSGRRVLRGQQRVDIHVLLGRANQARQPLLLGRAFAVDRRYRRLSAIVSTARL